MGFHKHKDEIIDSLTSGDISNISEVSYHDSDAYFENLMVLATVKNCTVKAVFPVWQIISIYVSQIVNRVPKCKNR